MCFPDGEVGKELVLCGVGHGNRWIQEHLTQGHVDLHFTNRIAIQYWMTTQQNNSYPNGMLSNVIWQQSINIFIRITVKKVIDAILLIFIWKRSFDFDMLHHNQGGISSSVLSVFFTDKFALSQSDAMISVAYNSCQWKTLTKRLMKCPPGLPFKKNPMGHCIIPLDIHFNKFEHAAIYDHTAVSIIVGCFLLLCTKMLVSCSIWYSHSIVQSRPQAIWLLSFSVISTFV